MASGDSFCFQQFVWRIRAIASSCRCDVALLRSICVATAREDSAVIQETDRRSSLPISSRHCKRVLTSRELPPAEHVYFVGMCILPCSMLKNITVAPKQAERRLSMADGRAASPVQIRLCGSLIPEPLPFDTFPQNVYLQCSSLERRLLPQHNPTSFQSIPTDCQVLDARRGMRENATGHSESRLSSF